MGIIRKHGGYRKLKSYQVSELVYDVTVRFCDKFISRFSRTHDQMVQAARSGCRNIAEGSKASATSAKMEMKLTGVAKASLEELRLDYEGFLRQNELTLWTRDNHHLTELIRRRPESADDVGRWAVDVKKATKSPHAEILANGSISLIIVATSLLDRQLKAQAATFEKEGGFTERLYSHRSRARRRR
jgi:four helix bundle suffix protein